MHGAVHPVSSPGKAKVGAAGAGPKGATSLKGASGPSSSAPPKQEPTAAKAQQLFATIQSAAPKPTKTLNAFSLLDLVADD